MARLGWIGLIVLVLLAPSVSAEDERPALAEARRSLTEAEAHLNDLLTSKTEKHPAVIRARQRVTRAKDAYTRAGGTLSGTTGSAKSPAPNPALERRVQHEMAKARLRLLLDKRAVAEEDLRKLRMTKTEQHPRVLAARKRLTELNRFVTTQADRAATLGTTATPKDDSRRDKLAQAAKLLDEAGAPEEAARVRTHLETPAPTTDAPTTLAMLRAEVQALRADVEELKKLLRAALAKERTAEDTTVR